MRWIKLSMIVLIALLPVGPAPAGGPAPVYGPQTFERTGGESDLYVETFESTAEGDFVLYVLNGDEEGFRRLAEANVQTIADSGAKRVIFSCPECYNAFRSDYPRFVGQLPFEVVHLVELLNEHIDQLELGDLEQKVTFHDPCRMGRYLGLYDEPRALIEAIPGTEMVEMRKNRAAALCCGSAGWVNCGRCAKGIQTERLRQAQATGATRMVTACPKCRIHLTCALKDTGDEFDVELEDLARIIVRAMNE